MLRAAADASILNELSGYDDFTEADVEEIRTAVDSYEACRLLGRKLGARTGVTWVPQISNDTYGHTGEYVPFFPAVRELSASKVCWTTPISRPFCASSSAGNS